MKIRKPRVTGVSNDVGDSISFAPHDDGVIVFELYAREPGSQDLFIDPKLARKMAANLIKMADWLEQTGRA